MGFEDQSGFISSNTSWGKWGQTIDDVTIEIDVPNGISSKEIKCMIKTDRISVIVRNSKILEGNLYDVIVPDDSVWTLEDKKLLRILLQKRERHAGNCWKSLMADNTYAVDPMTFQEMEKKLTLERFQRENPGMNFANAEVTGNYHDGGPKM